jgi:ribosome-associated translation inhibitor RaiA
MENRSEKAMQTPFQIAFKNMPSSEFFETHVSRRVAKLDRLRRDIVFCRVVLEAPNHSSEPKPPLAIAIEVEVPKRTIIAREVERRHEVKHDVLAVINRAFDAIERQLDDDIRTKRDRAQIAQRGRRNAKAEDNATADNG